MTRLFRRSGSSPDPKALASHRLYHGHIALPESDQVIDEVLVAIMRAPHSFTREDVVEIQAHAGQAVLRAILESVLSQGARLADPGEFTRRAFLNGRIDLTQAEAVIDVINAQSDRALTAAARQLHGAIGERLGRVRRVLEDLMARIDAAIDFGEDGIEEISMDDIADRVENDALPPLVELCRGYETARFLREGVRLAVVGAPNVGKSSLMNALLAEDRAIVTPIPGTTRDVIGAPLCINGVPLLLLDTAGYHRSVDPVEVMGIQKTRDSIDTADLVLLILDGSRPLTQEDAWINDLTQSKERIIVCNKQDLVHGTSSAPLPETWGQSPLVRTSALTGQGIDELRKAISDATLGSLPEEGTLLPNFRQHQELSKAADALRRVLSGSRTGTDMELLAIDLLEAHRTLGDLVGETTPPDILDRIFNQFCIGK